MILLTKKWQESRDWGKTCGTCERFVRDYPLSPGGTCEIPKRKRKSHKRKKNKSQNFDGPKRVYQTRKACSYYKEMEDLMLTKKEAILKILPEIKLDTNGTNPQMLIKCLPLLDYIAMDIKGPLYKYYDICGIKPNIEDVYEDITIQVYNSVDIIKNCGISYEFRTTIVEDELNVEDFKHINHLLYGAETYYLQRFTPTKTLDKSYMSRIPPKDMSPFINVLKDIKNVYVR